MEMAEDLLEQAVALKAKGEAFVLATVVACRPPTSAKPGAKAIVKADGTCLGWVGGSCTHPLLIQEAIKALEDGQPRLLLLTPNPEQGSESLKGVLPVPMTCQSEGSLEIYLEPYLAKPQLFVIGLSPMAQSLAVLGKVMGFSVHACDAAANEASFPQADSILREVEAVRARLGRQSFVVVATMGHYDEEALAAVVESEARYVGLIASPRRGEAVLRYLKGKGVSDQALGRVKCPAGLDIGAVTPEEIALSIIAEIVQLLRREAEEVSGPLRAPQAAATDPVCGMTVSTEARYTSSHNGTAFYFCCLGCKEKFDREPGRYLGQGVRG